MSFGKGRSRSAKRWELAEMERDRLANLKKESEPFNHYSGANMETTKLKIAGGNGFVEIDMNKSSRFDVEITDADYPKVAPDYEAMCKELAEAIGAFLHAGIGNSTHFELQSHATALGRAALSKYRGMKP